MNFRRKSILGLFVLGFLIAVAAALYFDRLWVFFAILIPAHAVLLHATLSPYSQGLGPVVTRFQTDRREVWLTIDDGPAPGETEAVLEVLERFGAKATFFLIGDRAAEHPALVEKIRAAGHGIGNHTATHPQAWWWVLPRSRIGAEIAGWFNRVESPTQPGSIETPIELFRSPVGMKPVGLHPVLEKFGLTLIGWSARGRDGIRCDLDRVLSRLQARIEPGAIILIHEGRDHAPALLEKLLTGLEAEGYDCVLPSTETFVCGGRR